LSSTQKAKREKNINLNEKKKARKGGKRGWDRFLMFSFRSLLKDLNAETTKWSKRSNIVTILTEVENKNAKNLEKGRGSGLWRKG